MIELHAVRFAVLDFDGVFTDDRVGCVYELCNAVRLARKESG